MRTPDAHGTVPQLRRRTPLRVSTAPEQDAATLPKLTTPKKKWIQRWSLEQEQTREPEPEQSAASNGPEDGEVVVDGGVGVGVGVGVGTDANEATADLRVAMPSPPPHSSTLSPSGDRSSPTPTSASISPSANKVKENEASPGKMLVDPSRPPPPPPPSSASSSSSLTSSESIHDDDDVGVVVEQKPTASKRKTPPLTPTLAPILKATVEEFTPSEKLRLERRKKRKSNWDVGDPRAHGGTLDLAALSLLSSTNAPATHPASFAKFPRTRPAFRQSQSLDANVPSRRAFHHSNSLPIERRPRQPPSRFPPSYR